MARKALDEKLRDYRVYKNAVIAFNKDGYVTREAVILAAEKFGCSVYTIRRAMRTLKRKPKKAI